MYSQLMQESFNFLPLISTLQPLNIFKDRDNKPIYNKLNYFTTYETRLEKSFWNANQYLSVIDCNSYNQSMNAIKNYATSVKLAFGFDSKANKKKVIVVGTGWSSLFFLKGIDVSKFDVTVVSPRNYFIFTPILPLTVGGSITFESCIEPIHKHLRRGFRPVMKYYEALVESVNQGKNSVSCSTFDGKKIELDYDYLVLAVGADTNTFGIPGVEENCFFFKEVHHARHFKEKIFSNLEKASLPSTTDEEKEKLLHVVVVGAGPTGVETGAEIWDLMCEEGRKHFPSAAPFMKVTIVEMLPNVLPAYNSKSQAFAKKHLTSSGLNIKCNTAVTKVTKDTITFKTKNDQGTTEVEEPYGVALWASGVTQTKLGKAIQSSIPEQATNRVLTVDAHLKVKGSNNIFAMGDCCMLSAPPLTDLADTLFEEAQKLPTGAGSTYMAEKAKQNIGKQYPQIHPSKYNFETKAKNDHLNKGEFLKYLQSIDNSYKSPAPTAQNAKNCGNYLALTFNNYVYDGKENKAPAYIDYSAGKLAYLGKGRALFELNFHTFAGGFFSGAAWKAAYCSMLFSNKARIKFISDLAHSFFFGRYTYLEHKNEFR